MNEQAVRFGPWGAAVGVLCLADPPAPAGAGASSPGAAGGSPPPAVLFLNAGLLRSIGPHRLHVRLARRLAGAGFDSLRFDLSGIGDSGPRRDHLARAESVVTETVEAMDFLSERHGHERFVLFGICSGADQAVRTALADERVSGLVLVDGYAYRTRRYLLRYYAGRLLRPHSWWNLVSLQHPGYARLTHLFRRPRAALPSAPDGPRLGVYDRPPREEAERRLVALADRGCELCLAFTPSRHFNRAGQLAEMFPALAGSPRVGVEFFPDANHMFTLRASQDALMQRVEAWVRERWSD